MNGNSTAPTTNAPSPLALPAEPPHKKPAFHMNFEMSDDENHSTATSTSSTFSCLPLLSEIEGDTDWYQSTGYRGPSLAAPDAPYLVGRPHFVVASHVSLHHQEIRALHPWMTAIEERVQSLVQDVEHVQDVLDVAKTEVLEMRNYESGCADSAAEDTRKEVQDLRTRLSASERSKMSLITRLLRMEERISVLEQRPLGWQGPSDSSR
ncbi:hypothetical protein Tco_0553150 [Tanacetum coccineum]